LPISKNQVDSLKEYNRGKHAYADSNMSISREYTLPVMRHIPKAVLIALGKEAKATIERFADLVAA
jgi:hypothetical protein